MNTAFLKSFEILKKIYAEKAFSAIELNKQLNFAKTSDKALITKIVYGVLDCDIELDFIINQFVKKAKNDARIFLKIGAYCLKYLSIPPYAVVNDIAELSKISDDKFVVGFVNATLKAIAKAVENDKIVYPIDKTEFLSVKYSYPKWAILKLVRDYGIDETEKIVSTKLKTDTVVRVNTTKISICEFEKLLTDRKIDFEKTILKNAFYIKGLPDIDQTLFTAQSLSSMLIAHAVNSVGKCNLLDCCAAPGGKAVYLKELNPDCEIVACDIHSHRVDLIKSYAARMGVEVEAKIADSTVFSSEFENKFDYVLCDVPCSGFGVLDFRPDIKLNRTSEDISSLMKLQSAILENAARYVKAGGVLVYSTCTVFNHENGQIVDRFLKNNNDFFYSQIELPIESCANGQGKYQFLPHKDGVQGFFCARLKKKQ